METVLRTKNRGIWKAVTRAQLNDTVAKIGFGLLSRGFGRGDAAAILSETRLEAACVDLAILSAGAASVAIHPEDEADRVGHILASGSVRLAFVENEEQLDKILSIRDRCPVLERIVVFDMKGLRDFADATVTSLDAFGDGAVDQTQWAACVDAINADQTAVIQFPRSDTGGSGRALTHGDLAHMIAAAGDRLALRPGDERLAVLRMSDMTERVWGLYLGLQTGCIGNYPERPDTAVENLQELQPTVFGADAEVWDHLYGLVTQRAKGATATQRMAYNWAVSARGVMAGLANLLVLRAVRKEFGLNRLRLAYVGGAAVAPAALDWAAALGITIQRVDEPAGGTGKLDERTRTLLQTAYA